MLISKEFFLIEPISFIRQSDSLTQLFRLGILVGSEYGITESPSESSVICVLLSVS